MVSPPAGFVTRGSVLTIYMRGDALLRGGAAPPPLLWLMGCAPSNRDMSFTSLSIHNWAALLGRHQMHLRRLRKMQRGQAKFDHHLDLELTHTLPADGGAKASQC